MGSQCGNIHFQQLSLSHLCGKGIFSQSQLPVKTLLWCLYSPHVQWHACLNICVHVKYHKHWQPYHCLDPHTQKILHSLIGVGSAALAAAVIYPGKVTQIPRWRQRIKTTTTTTTKVERKKKKKKNEQCDMFYSVCQNWKLCLPHRIDLTNLEKLYLYLKMTNIYFITIPVFCGKGMCKINIT